MGWHVRKMKAKETDMAEKITDECSGCGDIITEGEVHDCPVLGTQVTVTRS